MLVLGYHFVINGCNWKHQRDIEQIRSYNADDIAAVMCCDEDSNACADKVMRVGEQGHFHDKCHPKATFTRAIDVCEEYGKRLNRNYTLCPRNSELNYRCCKSNSDSCGYDNVAIWIADGYNRTSWSSRGIHV